MDHKIFSRNLKALLELKNLKQAEFARMIDVSPAYISNILACRSRNISSFVISKMASALNLKSSDILTLGEAIVDVHAFINEQASLIVPFFPTVNDLKSKIAALANRNFRKELSLNSFIGINPFISFPAIVPFLPGKNHRVLAIFVDIETGMQPFIKPGNIVFVDFGDFDPKEGHIFLVFVKGELKFRYAILEKVKSHSLIRLWPEESRFAVDLVDFPEPEFPIILGRVRAVTHLFNNFDSPTVPGPL